MKTTEDRRALQEKNRLDFWRQDLTRRLMRIEKALAQIQAILASRPRRS